jgi:predicted small metal-binding protein
MAAERRSAMAREFRCADLGMKCDWSVKASTDEEVLKKASAHAAQAHHMAKIEEPMLSQLKKAIRAA